MPQITISGDVNLIGWNGKRLSIWENYDVPGQPKSFSRLWTAWFDMSQVEEVLEGSWVEITGELSTKIGSYTPKNSGLEKSVIEHHVQNARIVKVMPKSQQNADPSPNRNDGYQDAPF